MGSGDGVSGVGSEGAVEGAGIGFVVLADSAAGGSGWTDAPVLAMGDRVSGSGFG